MLLTGTVNALTPKGTGLLKQDDGYAVYLSDALPGEHISYRLEMRAKRYALGHVVQRHNDNPNRVTPVCPLAQRCGGCQMQHLGYNAQLDWKTKTLKEALSFLETTYLPTVQSSPYRWRNKLQLDVDPATGVLGLSERNTKNLIDIPACSIVSDTLNMKLASFRDFYKKQPIPGLCRIVLREHQNRCMLILYAPKSSKNVLTHLKKQPEFDSIYLIPTDFGAQSDAALKEKPVLLYGAPYLYERLGHIDFPVGPTGFFQGNGTQYAAFVDAIAHACYLTPTTMLWDLHAGAGLLGLGLSKQAGQVYLSETHEESRKLGEETIFKNHISNARYQAMSAEDAVKDLDTRATVLLDPPRQGCSKTLINALCQKKPKQIVYVSCNLPPFVQATKELLAAGYVMKHIQLVDMFPQTIHMETVALFVTAKQTTLPHTSFNPSDG